MNWNIKDDGDPLEKKCKELIRSKIKNYNEFWSKYVGNINGKPIKIDGISEEQNKKRLMVAQWNYTLLRNIFQIKQIKEKNDKSASPNIVNNIDIQIHIEMDFILVTHLFYNIIEIVEKIKKQIGDNTNSTSKFDDFKMFRNVLAHNIKPLTKIINKKYCVPKNLEWFSAACIHNDDTWIWDNKCFNSLKYQSLSLYYEKYYTNALDLFNGVLLSEIEFFDKELKGKKIQDKGTNVEINNNGSCVASGTTITYS